MKRPYFVRDLLRCLRLALRQRLYHALELLDDRRVAAPLLWLVVKALKYLFVPLKKGLLGVSQLLD
ncbi:hypothetical protein [Mumia zhuanghuii]|uniref:Uncharacterized protein n=1 Tax=Mumia zhuanghuii TaxID=2585211 RepID=A0A5C4MDY0_9ACTN|nr:hypothetical protein [Mumia zhuanghuii]TNC35599.1 hypothetical protein FHE65_27000 [Mumia zhuanghuii]